MKKLPPTKRPVTPDEAFKLLQQFATDLVTSPEYLGRLRNRVMDGHATEAEMVLIRLGLLGVAAEPPPLVPGPPPPPGPPAKVVQITKKTRKRKAKEPQT